MFEHHPEHRAAVEAALAECHAARDAFLPLQAVCTALRKEIATHQQSAQEAEAEAARLRAENKGLLRSFTSHLSPKCRELKAQERAAYTLAEDWRELASELEKGLDEADEDASEQWYRVVIAQNGLRECYSQALIEVGLSQLPPALKLGLQLQADCLASKGQHASWRLFDESSLDAAWRELAPKLLAQCKQAVDIPDEAIRAGLQVADRGCVPELTPAQMHVRRYEREKAAEAEAAQA
ncbi:hypothetical protein [Chitinimonas sp. BJB300]|uniref:hypothetical protein n=1 Tax=Chitinimonas sp. BJB300 TaxID=1559339 RepID=UPI000C12237B|nr:hypothetical protein [Chitinimonas sp. BJB300]PHV09893.1 hypothetical protein CSQ89_19190 [Chitinimonas sp. BJB300]TSJ83043.1 hypothetical protein FG002_021690 [Chitinimonas sp. BJB300]